MTGNGRSLACSYRQCEARSATLLEPEMSGGGELTRKAKEGVSQVWGRMSELAGSLHLE